MSGSVLNLISARSSARSRASEPDPITRWLHHVDVMLWIAGAAFVTSLVFALS